MNANETTVVELNDGRLYFNTRDQGGKAEGTRGEAYSDMVRLRVGKYGVLFEAGKDKKQYDRIVFAVVTQGKAIRNETGNATIPSKPEIELD